MNLRIAFSLCLIAALAACGGGGGDAPPVPAPPVTVASIAQVSGDVGGAGNLDGTGDAARFSFSTGVTVDEAGTAYVADYGNQKIRRVSATGEVSVLAGMETPGNLNFMHPQRDGDRSTALFNRPSAVAFDAVRRVLYVADYDRVRRVTLDGTVSTVFLNEFPGNPSFSPYPSAVAVAPDGAVIVAAGTTGSGIRSCCTPTALYRFPLNGAPTLLAGDAKGSDFSASSIAVDRAGNVYAAAGTVLRKVTPDGTVSIVAGSNFRGFADGVGSQARFGGILWITVDADGNVVASDPVNRAIRKVTPAGVVSVLYGDVPGPGSLTIDASGRILYLAQQGLFSAQPGNQARLIAGTYQPSGNGPFLGRPTVRDSHGNFFRANFDGAIQKFAADGTILAFGPAAGDLAVAPPGSSYRNVLSIDAADNLYQSYAVVVGTLPSGSSDLRGSIVRISPAGQSTVIASSSKDSAQPIRPVSLRPDAAGNVYFIDEFGPAIRKLGPTGIISMVADLSTAPEIGAGPSDFGLAVDRNGTVYMNSERRCVVYRIDAAGKPAVFAGQLDKCGSSVDGPPGAALLNAPKPPVLDSAGNLYVAEISTIRKIAPNGTVTTVAGQAGLVGTRLGALPGSLAPVRYLWIAADDTLYVAAGDALLQIR